jgi:two-component system LytT family sensor kinase
VVAFVLERRYSCEPLILVVVLRTAFHRQQAAALICPELQFGRRKPPTIGLSSPCHFFDEFYPSMKKILLHMAFWTFYLLQNVLLIFFVNVTRLQQPTYKDLILSIENCLVILLPKLFFTYFMLQVALPRMASRNQQRRGLIYAVLALVFTLFLYRSLVVYFVNPLIYHWHNDAELFYPLGFLVALMDVGFVSGAAIAIRQARQQRVAQEREQTLVKEKLASELKFLRSQTNPHFLFNTLNNIYALARKKSDLTPEVVLKLSKLLRFILYETGRPFIPIGDEVRVLDDYIELEKMRYTDRLTVNFYQEIDDYQEFISPLLLLPFVENAFKHGPGQSHADAHIHIDLVVQNGMLTFSVENTKESSPHQPVNENIGLSNVKRQLELTYSDYSLEVLSEPALFKILLSINLKVHEKDQLSRTGR